MDPFKDKEDEDKQRKEEQYKNKIIEDKKKEEERKKRVSQERKNKKNDRSNQLFSDIFPFYGEDFKYYLKNKENFEVFKKIEVILYPNFIFWFVV
jgi:hypothetical protein